MPTETGNPGSLLESIKGICEKRHQKCAFSCKSSVYDPGLSMAVLGRNDQWNGIMPLWQSFMSISGMFPKFSRFLPAPNVGCCGTLCEDESPFRKNRRHLIKTKRIGPGSRALICFVLFIYLYYMFLFSLL